MNKIIELSVADTPITTDLFPLKIHPLMHNPNYTNHVYHH